MISARPTDSIRLRWLAWLSIFLVAWMAYRPGLAGGFLFDDHVNLDALGRYGNPLQWDLFWRYLTSGSADPLGRPVSLLSFLVDAQAWPADPYPFLRTNLLIHLLNGALLGALMYRLEVVLGGDESRRGWTALLGAAMWMLHPLFVSTTLYAVQRQAMLPATFTLLGLLCFVIGRERVAQGRPGYHLLAVGLVGCTTLAALSKANGILLPLLAGTLELSVLTHLPPAVPEARAKLRWILVLLLGLPSLAVFLYLLSFLPQLNEPISYRGWSVGERLLTEPRVLLDYLRNLAIPRTVTSGLFNDGFAVSSSWRDPWTTLPALALLLGAATWAWRQRSRQPAIALAILFFLAGHALESSTVPLELYFEHRNYLPAALLFWPLARAIVGAPLPVRGRAVIASFIVAVLAFVTWQRADLWGHPQQLAQSWSIKNPTSLRSQVSAAVALREAGHPDRALGLLLPLWKAHPQELQVAFNVVDARCASVGLQSSDVEGIERALRSVPRIELMTNQWLSRAIDAGASGLCAGLDLPVATRWVAALAANPALAGSRRADEDIEPLRAQIALRQGDVPAAVVHLRKALLARPSPDVAARQVVLLASDGRFEEALAYLDAYEHDPRTVRAPLGMKRVHAWVLEAQGYWPHEFAVLRERLQAEIAARAKP